MIDVRGYADEWAADNVSGGLAGWLNTVEFTACAQQFSHRRQEKRK